MLAKLKKWLIELATIAFYLMVIAVLCIFIFFVGREVIFERTADAVPDSLTSEQKWETEQIDKKEITTKDIIDSLDTTRESGLDTFYHDSLNKEEERCYQVLYQGIMGHMDKIEVTISDQELIRKLLNCVLQDHVEIFWVCPSQFRMTTYTNRDDYAAIELTYQYDTEEIKQIKRELTNEMMRLLKDAPEGERERAEYALDYLIKHVTYKDTKKESELQKMQNIDSAFNGESVCAGYAKYYKYILNHLGMHSVYVSGKGYKNGEPTDHAWNLVSINGTFCYIDPTWSELKIEENGKYVESDICDYHYFGMNDEMFFKDHKNSSGYDYPKCCSKEEYYYIREKVYYEDCNEENLKEVVMRDFIMEKESSIFKFASPDLYNNMKPFVEEELCTYGLDTLAHEFHVTAEASVQSVRERNLLVIHWKRLDTKEEIYEEN